MRHIGSRQALGQLLKELRQSCGYSYRALSAKTGINPGTLEGWEKARHWPLLNKLNVLLSFYGETVSIGWEEQK
jgi:transcriptional regulator with XRE-family HTH domain